MAEYIVNGQKVDPWGNPVGEKEVVAGNAATDTTEEKQATPKRTRKRPAAKKDD